jgi:hypothetical protein
VKRFSAQLQNPFTSILKIVEHPPNAFSQQALTLDRPAVRSSTKPRFP